MPDANLPPDQGRLVKRMLQRLDDLERRIWERTAITASRAAPAPAPPIPDTFNLWAGTYSGTISAGSALAPVPLGTTTDIDSGIANSTGILTYSGTPSTQRIYVFALSGAFFASPGPNFAGSEIADAQIVISSAAGAPGFSLLTPSPSSDHAFLSLSPAVGLLNEGTLNHALVQIFNNGSVDIRVDLTLTAVWLTERSL